MKPEELKTLSKIADKLTTVAGTIMMVACQDPEIHEETCMCHLCRAYVNTQNSITELEKIIRDNS